MSNEDYEEYIVYDMIKMIYKQNEDKENKKEKIKILKEKHGFYFDDEKEYSGEVLRIFGKYFVKRNKNKCKLIYNNKKYR